MPKNFPSSDPDCQSPKVERFKRGVLTNQSFAQLVQILSMTLIMIYYNLLVHKHLCLFYDYNEIYIKIVIIIK